MSHIVAVQLIAQKSGEAAKAGPIGLAMILLLCIACYFLFKSMSRHMRNVRENFPSDGVPQGGEAARRVVADRPREDRLESGSDRSGADTTHAVSVEKPTNPAEHPPPE